MIKLKLPDHTGNITHLGMDFNNPKLRLEFNDIRQLLILVGSNGTGKTFMLICTWYLSYIVQAIVHSRNMSRDQVLAFATFIFKHTFDDPDTMTGELKATFEHHVTIDIQINKGKAIDCIVYLPKNITRPTNAKFMSKNMRTFDAMTMYLKLRRTVGSASREKIVEEMLKNFKMYDVLYVEGLIEIMPITVDPSLEARIHNFDDTMHIDQFCVDIAKAEFYTIDKQGVRKNLCTYGAGHQSLFNMLIGTP